MRSEKLSPDSGPPSAVHLQNDTTSTANSQEMPNLNLASTSLPVVTSEIVESPCLLIRYIAGLQRVSSDLMIPLLLPCVIYLAVGLLGCLLAGEQLQCYLYCAMPSVQHKWQVLCVTNGIVCE